jgi:hypothetical protein
MFRIQKIVLNRVGGESDEKQTRQASKEWEVKILEGHVVKFELCPEAYPSPKCANKGLSDMLR